MYRILFASGHFVHSKKGTYMFHLCPFCCTIFPQAGENKLESPPPLSIGEEKSFSPTPTQSAWDRLLISLSLAHSCFPDLPFLIRQLPACCPEPHTMKGSVRSQRTNAKATQRSFCGCWKKAGRQASEASLNEIKSMFCNRWKQRAGNKFPSRTERGGPLPPPWAEGKSRPGHKFPCNDSDLMLQQKEQTQARSQGAGGHCTFTETGQAA